MVMERPSPCMDLFSFLELHGGSLDEKTTRQVMHQVTHAAKVSCERGVSFIGISNWRTNGSNQWLVNMNTMEVKLIDFGCGALMRKKAFKVFTGTKEYFPPEFEVDSKYYAKPMTLWSLGILLFIMVCGALPSPCDLHMITANLWTSPGPLDRHQRTKNNLNSKSHKKDHSSKESRSKVSWSKTRRT